MSRTASQPQISRICYIHSLPVELMIDILEYLTPATKSDYEPEYYRFLPIPLVSRHWQRLYDPILYRTIDLGYRGRGKTRRTSTLSQTLETRSELRTYVKEIIIRLSRPSHVQCVIIPDIIQYCTSIRKLTLHTHMSSEVWPIIDTAGKLQKLQSLHISSQIGGPHLNLQMILSHFSMPTLKELEIRRYGLSVNSESGVPWPQTVSPTQQRVEDYFSTCHHHDTLTTLRLDAPSTPPEVTEKLLQWPRHLTSLSITNLVNANYTSMYTIAAVQTLLDTQRDSLQHVVLGRIIEKGKNGIPDLSGFQCLRTLQVSAYNFLALRPEKALENLSAPLLHHLTLSWGKEDRLKEQYFAMTETHVTWLERFAVCMTSDHATHPRLPKIFVEFSPDNHLWAENYISRFIVGNFGNAWEGPEWPWDYLEVAARALSGYGVDMTYSEPIWTRLEWRQKVDTIRKIHQICR